MAVHFILQVLPYTKRPFYDCKESWASERRTKKQIAYIHMKQLKELLQ